MPNRLTVLRREWRQLSQTTPGYHATRMTNPMERWYERELAHIRRLNAQRLVSTIDVREFGAVSVSQSSDPTFGIEIECIMTQGMTRRSLASLLVAEGIDASVEDYNHSTSDHWKLVTDGSLGDYTRGAEIVSPILRGEAGLELVRRVCRVLDANNVKVNRRCGFHVHIGVDQDSPTVFFRNLLKLYAHYEPVLDTLVSSSRRGNNNVYCRSTKHLVDNNITTINAAVDARYLARTYSPGAYGDEERFGRRFVKLNLAAYWRHGTVEFRQHQGTINAVKATTWIRLCLGLVSAAKANATPEGDTLDALAEKVGMTNDLPYWRSRQRVLDRVRNERT